jgi:hypothetical protein
MTRTFLLAASLLVTFAACGGTEAEGGAARTDEDAITACDLVTSADAEAIVGPATGEPSAHEISGMDGERATSCMYPGTSGTLTVRAWHPYGGNEATSTALVQRLKSERADQAAAETDPAIAQFTASTVITEYDGLGMPAALEDMRASLGSVTLHIMKPSARAYLAIDAATPELARAAAERAVARLP